MNKKLRGFAKDSFFYGIGDGIGRITSLILVPILSRIFVPAQYGVIDFLTVSFAFLAEAIPMNLPTGLQKFYYAEQGEQRRVLVTSTFCGLFCLALPFAFLFLFTSRLISERAFQDTGYATAVAILGCSLPLSILQDSLLMLLRLNRRAILFSFYNVVSLALSVLLTYWLVVGLDTGLAGVFLARLFTSTVIVLLLVVQQRREWTCRIRYKAFRGLLLYSLPGHPANIVRSVMGVLPVYMLTQFSTLAGVGIYGMANRVARLLGLYMTSFNRAWNPFAFENAGKRDEKRLYEKVLKIYAASLLLLSLGLSLYAKEILAILTPPEYHTAFPLVGGICIYNGLMGVRPVLSTALYSANRIQWTSYLNLVHLAVFFTGSVLFIPEHGALGLVLALDLSAVMFLSCYLIVLRRYFKFPIPFARLGLLLGLAFGMVGVLNRFEMPPVPLLSIKTGLLLVMCIACYHILFNRSEKAALREGLAWALNKIGTLSERERHPSG